MGEISFAPHLIDKHRGEFLSFRLLNIGERRGPKGTSEFSPGGRVDMKV